MCSACSNIRGTFVEKLRELLGNRYAAFDKHKTAYVLGSEFGNTTSMIYSA